MNTKCEIFISVDIETSGPIPSEYSLLTIGACNVDDDNQTFTCQIKPISHKADPKALEVTGLSLDTLEREGLRPIEAMQEFNDWIESLVETDNVIVFVGFNAAFDWSFINYYFHRYLGRNPFGFTALDIKSFYMGKTGCSWYQTRSSYIANTVQPQLRGDHNALHDAQYQAEIFRLIRDEHFSIKQ
jgi:DNA polymerase III epsilon subunit-like protein